MANRKPIVINGGETEELQDGDTLDIPALEIAGVVAYTGVITPPALTTNTNNWSPTGLESANRIDIKTTGNINITGINAATFNDGRVIRLRNDNSNNDIITLISESASSSVSNRFGFSTNQRLKRGEWIELMYSLDKERFFRSV